MAGDYDLLQEEDGYIEDQWPPLIRIVKGLETGVTTLTLILPDGTAAVPAVRWANDLNSGVFRPAGADADQFGISLGATERIRLSSTGLEIVDSGSRLTLPSGSVTNPSARFTAETNLGYYRSGAGVFTIAAGNLDRLSVSSAGIRVIPAGTDVAPSISVAATDKGFYSPGTDLLGFCIQGYEAMRMIGDGTTYCLAVDFGSGIGVGEADGSQVFAGAWTDLDVSNLIRSRAGFTAPRYNGTGRYGYFFDTEDPSVAPTGFASSAAGTLMLKVSGADGFTMDGVVANNRFRWFASNGTTEIMRLRSSGLLGLGTSTPTQLFHVNGGNLRIQSGTLRNSDGTAGDPSYTFESSPDAGMFLISTDILGWSTADTERLRLGTQLDANCGARQTLITMTSSGGTVTPDLNSSNLFYYQLASGEALTVAAPSNKPASGESATIIIQLKQHGTTPGTVAYATGAGGWFFPGGTVHVMSTGVDEYDVVTGVYNVAADRWFATFAQDYS